MENYVKDKRQERTDTEHGSGYEGDDRAGSRTAYSGKEGQKADGEGYSGRMQYHPADLLLPFRGNIFGTLIHVFGQRSDADDLVDAFAGSVFSGFKMKAVFVFA